MDYFWVLLLSLTSLAMYHGIGVNIYDLCQNVIIGNNQKPSLSRYNSPFHCSLWLLGCMAHILITFILYRLGLSLGITFLGTLIIFGVFSKKNIAEDITAFSFNISFPTAAYFLFVLCIGISQVSFENNISTIWSNNYSDLPFHLAIIQNYRFGEAPLWDYPIFPGVSLSYYVLYDFWTACLTSLSTHNACLQYAMLYQWLCATGLIYFACRNITTKLLPYALLLGGSTWHILLDKQFSIFTSFSNPNSVLSHHYINKGFPWTAFMSTIWIPQRAAIFGAAILCSSMMLFYSSFLKTRTHTHLRPLPDNRSTIPILFMLPTLGALFHAHFALITLLVISCSLLLLMFQSKKWYLYSIKTILASGLLGIILSTPALIILLGKSSLRKTISGWKPWKHEWFEIHSIDFLKALPDFITHSTEFYSAVMWFFNLGIPLLFLIAFVLWKSPLRFFLPIVFIFLLFNKVQIGGWDWDQIKLFIALYCVFMCFAALTLPRSLTTSLLFLIVLIPGAAETIAIFFSAQNSEIYSSKDITVSNNIRNNIAPDAIIADYPKHNSPITLAGRKMYLGYEGWLGSHGIEYQQRKQVNSKLLSRRCNKNWKSNELRPDFVRTRHLTVKHSKYSYPEGVTPIKEACTLN